ncbi:hypothetical protein HII36_19495 [Nonomuraea sp. NN258]|uniref:hypothetical protein n=1 Tax=Nonomuraea antri TaxID=2730852 RepID=UPI0015689167|nr:hypothetical protein [Nonomuraea antri]NRQ34020.1 hypothetical protein [Nonomuraea antri]
MSTTSPGSHSPHGSSSLHGPSGSTSSSGSTGAAGRVLTPQFAVVAGGLVGAMGAAAYISSFFLLSDLSGREAVRSPLCVTANVLITIGFVTVALALPALAGPLRLPRWAAVTAGLGCAFLATIAWAMATIGVDFAGTVTDAQWDSPGLPAFLGVVPKMLLCAVGFAALAVAGWRGRGIPRGACVLLVLAGVVAVLLMPHQPTALLGGLALAWAAKNPAKPG